MGISSPACVGSGFPMTGHLSVWMPASFTWYTSVWRPSSASWALAVHTRPPTMALMLRGCDSHTRQTYSSPCWSSLAPCWAFSPSLTLACYVGCPVWVLLYPARALAPHFWLLPEQRPSLPHLGSDAACFAAPILTWIAFHLFWSPK